MELVLSCNAISFFSFTRERKKCAIEIRDSFFLFAHLIFMQLFIYLSPARMTTVHVISAYAQSVLIKFAISISHDQLSRDAENDKAISSKSSIVVVCSSVISVTAYIPSSSFHLKGRKGIHST